MQLHYGHHEQQRYLVVHLLRTIEHIDYDAEGTAQILGGLSFAGSSGTSRGSTHDEMEGLSESDVTPVTYHTILRSLSPTYHSPK